MANPADREAFLEELEASGEEAVRRNMLDHIYGDGPTSGWRWVYARDFLEQKVIARGEAHRTAEAGRSERLVKWTRAIAVATAVTALAAIATAVFTYIASRP